jgi:hypothetical protein
LQRSGEELRSAPLRSRVQSPVGSEFRPGLKKLPRLSSFAKHRLRPGPATARCVALTRLSRGLRRPLCKGERGSGVFSVYVRRPFFLIEYRRGRSYLRQVEFFFKVQRAAAGALGTLFKNDENKAQVRYQQNMQNKHSCQLTQNCVCFHTNASTR